LKGGSNVVLSAAEAADYLDCSVDTLYRNWRAWELPGFYVGRQLKFLARGLDNWIERKVNAA
jgi:excisionase family DNA binding protein